MEFYRTHLKTLSAEKPQASGSGGLKADLVYDWSLAMLHDLASVSVAKKGNYFGIGV